MIRICLSNEEINLLQIYGAKSSIELMRLKAHAILLRHKSMSVGNIAEVMGRHYRTIERWLKDFSLRRMASIFSGMQDNEHAAKLTREQKVEIKEILQQPPSDYGLPKAFWDIPQLKDYIKAEFGIVYESVQSYYYLLRFSRLSFKYPDQFNLRRNETLIVQRLKEIRREIVPFLQDDNWEIFASDETGLLWEALTRKAWLKKGQKTVIKVNRSKERQSYLGFLNLKTGECHTYRIIKGKQEYIIEAMRKHLKKYPHKHLCILWDNASHHKGKLIREALSKNQPLERVHLIAFPPYAPDTNPIEHVWRESKDKISNHQYQDFETTKKVFERQINSRLFHYQI